MLKEKRYLYRGRVLSVQQTQTDLKYGVISSDRDKGHFGSEYYRWVKSFGKYASREEAQAALDAFAADRGLETCADA